MSALLNHPLGDRFLEARISNVSSSISDWISVPANGRIIAAWVTLSAAITSSNAAIALYSGVSSAMTNSTISIIGSGSSAGSVFSATPSANNFVTEGDFIEVRSSGLNSSGAAAGVVTLVLRT